MHYRPMQPKGPQELKETLSRKRVDLACFGCKQGFMEVRPEFLVLGPDSETENASGAAWANKMLVEVFCPKCGIVRHFNYGVLIS